MKRIALISASLSVADALLLWRFIETDAGAYLAAHFCLCVDIGAFAAAIRADSQDWSRSLGLLAAVMALTGPFGAAMIATGFWTAGDADAPQPVAVEHDPSDVALCRDLQEGRLRIAGAAETPAFIDVMASGSLAERLDVLTITARRYDPSLRASLRAGEQDEVSAVRVLAFHVLAKLRLDQSETEP